MGLPGCTSFLNDEWHFWRCCTCSVVACWFLICFCWMWTRITCFIFKHYSRFHFCSVKNKKTGNEGTGMFSSWNLHTGKLSVVSKRLGIVRCDNFHTYALWRDEKGHRRFFFSFRCTQFDPFRSDGEHVMILNIQYTSFCTILLCHVVI